MAPLTAAGRPDLTSDSVFFVGNGVLRVAPIGTGESGEQKLSPSWADYMDILWSFTKSGTMELADFAGLPAPRQAEWFDREFRAANHTTANVAALRLHLLGKILHSSSDILTNPLLAELARLIVLPATDAQQPISGVDVITTNVDCALEQNIASEFETLWQHNATTVVRVTIDTIVDFRLSARWVRSVADSGPEFRVRVWKVHGCLRDLKIELSRDHAMTRNVLDLAGDKEIGLCGQVPTDTLADRLPGWSQIAEPSTSTRSFSGVFSQSEYFENLLVLAGQTTDHHSADFRTLLETRPLIFVGYGIPEVDVDVVYALQRYRQRGDTKRWQLLAERDLSVGNKERLLQMGIDPWSFHVSPIGFAAMPGKLRAARRHEWRQTTEDPLTIPPERDWRRPLERVSAQAWLEPQLAALRSLAPQVAPAASLPVKRQRLVVAGLGSIWHGFALTNAPDFPIQRRVSARLISVDAGVPGGSGLVPVMVAAATAGPSAVGALTYFSNVPTRWSGWEAIEDLCLSAGIGVHSWQPAENEPETNSVGRTSHVIFFDPARADGMSQLPRQRFIMDVQALANADHAPQVADWSKLVVPPARLHDEFQTPDEEDFLFIDKESDPKIVAEWVGPTVYETGASGDEMVRLLKPANAKPTIWTAGVGSFVRTMVALAGRTPDEAAYGRGPRGVLDHLSEDASIEALADCGDLRERYLAKMVGFGRPGIWDHGGVDGFTYQDELDYGCWLRDRWVDLAPAMWRLLRTGTDSVLKKQHDQIGRGVLTTIHEGGLMAYWQWPDGSTESVVVTIDTTAAEHDHEQLTVTCEVSCAAGQQPLAPVELRVSRRELVLAVDGSVERLGPTDPIRRNTLAAGDTVRGAMAYGLWAAAYRQPAGTRADIRRIFLASAALATLKCYAGSFVDFLKLLERLRGSDTWSAIWGGI
jgi:hypothetical protein